MPIKRAKSKAKLTITLGDMFDNLKMSFNAPNFSVGYRLTAKKDSWLEKEKVIVKAKLEKSIQRISRKKIPNLENPKHWDIIASYMDKEDISRAIKLRGEWHKELTKAMDKRHEDNCYIKKN